MPLFRFGARSGLLRKVRPTPGTITRRSHVAARAGSPQEANRTNSVGQAIIIIDGGFRQTQRTRDEEHCFICQQWMFIRGPGPPGNKTATAILLALPPTTPPASVVCAPSPMRSTLWASPPRAIRRRSLGRRPIETNSNFLQAIGAQGAKGLL